MTTVVVTKKGGIACIAADTLATYGDMQESADLIANSDKLVRIGDAWVAPTGPASAQLVLKHFVSTFDELPCLEDTDGIFDFLTVLQRALRDEYWMVTAYEKKLVKAIDAEKQSAPVGLGKAMM